MLNLVDPQLIYTYKSQLDQSVPNPFFQYLTADKFPGQLRNQQEVSIGSLLSPYPQYGALDQTNTNGVKDRYHALQIKVQREFSKGFMFLAAYNYNREKTYNFFNDLDQYAGRFTYIDGYNPRHRMSVAGTYEFPFGKGRPYLSNMNPVL